jgi:hypothetical protein
MAGLPGYGVGNDKGQSELARRIDFTQTEISKLTTGQRPTPLNLWEMIEIEQACGRPHGYILTEMGYLPRERGAREAIQSSPDLDESGRAIVLAAYDVAAERALGAASVKSHSRKK